jgi:hypothetical protein
VNLIESFVCSGTGWDARDAFPGDRTPMIRPRAYDSGLVFGVPAGGELYGGEHAERAVGR